MHRALLQCLLGRGDETLPGSRPEPRVFFGPRGAQLLRPSLVPSSILLLIGPSQHTPDCFPVCWDSPLHDEARQPGSSLLWGLANHVHSHILSPRLQGSGQPGKIRHQPSCEPQVLTSCKQLPRGIKSRSDLHSTLFLFQFLADGREVRQG